MTALRRRLRSLALLAGVLWMSGCYTYRPVESPDPGSTVRISVPVTSAAGTAVMNENLSLEGSLLEFGDTISLSMRTRREIGAFRELVQLDTVRLARAETNSVELREFSAPRTILLGTVVAVALGTAAAFAFGLGGGDEGERPGPGDPVTALSVGVGTLLGLLGR